jgi:hypothetical protein
MAELQISFLQASPAGEATARVTAQGQAKATTPKIRNLRRRIAKSVTPKSVVLIVSARDMGFWPALCPSRAARLNARPEVNSTCRIATVAAFPRPVDGREKASALQGCSRSSSPCGERDPYS